MRASLVLLLLAASACQPKPPAAVEPAHVEPRGQTLFEELVSGQAAPGTGNLGPVHLVRADPGDPFIRNFTPEAEERTLFEAILQDPARSGGDNLGRVKLIRADPRDPFIRYFDGSR